MIIRRAMFDVKKQRQMLAKIANEIEEATIARKYCGACRYKRGLAYAGLVALISSVERATSKLKT